MEERLRKVCDKLILPRDQRKVTFKKGKVVYYLTGVERPSMYRNEIVVAIETEDRQIVQWALLSDIKI